MAKATLAAGCFWGVEDAFRRVPGIIDATVGYSGGTFPNPTYRDVCSDRTGHAESVEVTFDPDMISYDHVLDVFRSIHDPTTRNRQGPDVGSQYRSVIFVHDPEQDSAAKDSRECAQQNFSRPIVTEIVPASTFWPAEEYHQRYFEKLGGGAHCAR
jgi:peptide-methionine (S)-S-oxide reductase